MIRRVLLSFLETGGAGDGIRALDMKVKFTVSTRIREASSDDFTGIAVEGIRGISWVRNQGEGMRRV